MACFKHIYEHNFNGNRFILKNNIWFDPLFFHIKVRIVTLMILDKNVTFIEVFITDTYALVTAIQRSENGGNGG